jgi:hypothetical protein
MNDRAGTPAPAIPSRSVPTVAARLALAALAVVCAVVAIRALHGDHQCSQIKADAASVPPAELARVVDATVDRCGTPADRAEVVVTLITRKRPGLAVDLARRMTQTSPDDYNGWLALYRLDGDRRALIRAHQLNPRGTPAP